MSLSDCTGKIFIVVTFKQILYVFNTKENLEKQTHIAYIRIPLYLLSTNEQSILLCYLTLEAKKFTCICLVKLALIFLSDKLMESSMNSIHFCSRHYEEFDVVIDKQKGPRISPYIHLV